jgi:hypothetical protein
MKLLRFWLAGSLFLVLFSRISVLAQCNTPEVVKGATKYNTHLCQGISASEKGEEQKALGFFLEAAKEPVLESPNILLFGRIAETYARLGQFSKADLYLKYDDLSLRWLIGVVRCQAQSNSSSELLLQDGEPLNSPEANDMVGVLCGPIFDNNDSFADRDAESFVPVAKAIVRYSILRKEIDHMRAEQSSGKP